MKFLAIDDSKLALAQIEHFIKGIFPGAEVIKVQNPMDGVDMGLKYAEELVFIVIDYNMESMTGLDIIDALVPKIEPKKMALYTANTQISIKNEADKRGVHFVSKGELQSQLKDILSKIEVS